MALSGTQLTKLGERLRADEESEDDLRLLDEYRRSFSGASQYVVNLLRKELGLDPSARRAKSTRAIVDKLRRQKIRLVQIQDIAGCRVVLPSLEAQDKVRSEVLRLFPDAAVDDRRERPSSGYRAVHVIVKADGKMVEIQIRTQLQQLWAEVSEKASDRYGLDIKYGGGPDWLKLQLHDLSETVHNYEIREGLAELIEGAVQQQGGSLLQAFQEARNELAAQRVALREILVSRAEAPDLLRGEQ